MDPRRRCKTVLERYSVAQAVCGKTEVLAALGENYVIKFKREAMEASNAANDSEASFALRSARAGSLGGAPT